MRQGLLALLVLVCGATVPAYAAEVDLNDCLAGSGVITDTPELACVDEGEPPPPPPPPPPSGDACPIAPSIPTRNLIWDCEGIMTSVNTPEPGVWNHVNGYWGYMNPQLTCVQPSLGTTDHDPTIRMIDQVVYNRAQFGTVTFQDSSRVQWINVGAGSVDNVVIVNSDNVEVDGACQ